jgi:O-antigen/teichoic acid export membrane protein
MGNRTDTKAEIKKDGGRGLTQRAALLMAANVVATMISFALPPVLSRTMSQSEYGLYKQAFQIMASALALLNLQVAVSVFYFSERAPGKRLQVSLNVILFYSALGLLVFLVFLFWPGWVNLIFKDGSLLVPHIPLLGFAIFCYLVSTNLDAVPIAAGDVRIASVLIVLSQLTKAIIMIVAALVFGTINAILMAAIIQGLVQMTFMMGYIRRRFGRLLAPIDWPLMRAQIGNALPFGIGGIAAIVQNDMHSYFVSHYFDAATFAIYAVGCFQLPLLGMLATSFASALNPELAKHKELDDYRAIIDLWMEVIRKLALIFVPAFALLLVMRRELIILLYTTTYLESVPIFAINLIGVLIGIFVHLHILRLFDQLKFFRLKLYLALIPVTGGALYLGLRTGGLMGVAVAVVCIQTLDFGITLAMIKRELRMTSHDLRLLLPLLKIAAAAALASLVTVIFRNTLLHAHVLISLVVCAAAFGLAYISLSFALGVVSEDEKEWMRRLWLKLSRNGSNRMSSATEG